MNYEQLILFDRYGNNWKDLTAERLYGIGSTATHYYYHPEVHEIHRERHENAIQAGLEEVYDNVYRIKRPDVPDDAA